VRVLQQCIWCMALSQTVSCHSTGALRTLYKWTTRATLSKQLQLWCGKTISQHQHTIESASTMHLVHCSLTNCELPLNWCAAHTTRVDNKGHFEQTTTTLVLKTLSQHQHTIESAPNVYLVHGSLSNCELPLDRCAAHTIQVDNKGNSE
jgi:hypothetical protein